MIHRNWNISLIHLQEEFSCSKVLKCIQFYFKIYWKQYIIVRLCWCWSDSSFFKFLNFRAVWCMSTCRDAVFYCYMIIYNKGYILNFILAAILVLIIKLVFISILNFFPYEHASCTFLHQLQLDEKHKLFATSTYFHLCFLNFVPSVPFLCRSLYDLR
jgi:hypothetical protein